MKVCLLSHSDDRGDGYAAAYRISEPPATVPHFRRSLKPETLYLTIKIIAISYVNWKIMQNTSFGKIYD